MADASISACPYERAFRLRRNTAGRRHASQRRTVTCSTAFVWGPTWVITTIALCALQTCVKITILLFIEGTVGPPGVNISSHFVSRDNHEM